MIRCHECPHFTPHDRHYGKCEVFLFETYAEAPKLGQCGYYLDRPTDQPKQHEVQEAHEYNRADN